MANGKWQMVNGRVEKAEIMNGANESVVGPAAGAYPGFQEELKAREKKQERLAEAHAATLPGPLREAFAGSPQGLYGLTFLPVTAGLAAMLERINSPLLPTFQIVVSNRDKPKAEVLRLLNRKVKAKPEDFAETVFCFLHPPAELRGLLDKGRVAFREAAMAELADRMTVFQVARLYEAVTKYYLECFVTAVSYEAAPQEGGTVFTQPPAGPTTGSVGG